MTARVDGPRLLHRLDALGAVGGLPGGGVTRLAYGADDVAGRDLVAGWMRAAGLDVVVDAAGNLRGRRAGREGLGAIAVGSHLDTVVDAGTLDGAYGAVAAVEVAAGLAAVPLRHDLLVLGISNEEGARGTPGMVGSLCLAGDPPDLEEPDDEGVALGERLRAVGGDPALLPTAALADCVAFLELHIEQGPVLEHAQVPVGVVTAITGRVNLEVEVLGRASHAGTTPMGLRRDALAAAARLVLAVEEIGAEGAVRVATAGRLVTSPGVRNVVAGRAELSLDLRDVDPERLADGVQQVEAAAARIASATGTQVLVRQGAAVPPVATDPGLTACVRAAAHRLGLPTLDLPSGAGHDAQVLARLAPVGMVFVPSIDGLSHSPREATAPEQLVAGADVLLHALLLADEQLPPALR